MLLQLSFLVLSCFFWSRRCSVLFCYASRRREAWQYSSNQVFFFSATVNATIMYERVPGLALPVMIHKLPLLKVVVKRCNRNLIAQLRRVWAFCYVVFCFAFRPSCCACASYMSPPPSDVPSGSLILRIVHVTVAFHLYFRVFEQRWRATTIPFRMKLLASHSTSAAMHFCFDISNFTSDG